MTTGGAVSGRTGGGTARTRSAPPRIGGPRGGGRTLDRLGTKSSMGSSSSGPGNGSPGEVDVGGACLGRSSVRGSDAAAGTRRGVPLTSVESEPSLCRCRVIFSAELSCGRGRKEVSVWRFGDRGGQGETAAWTAARGWRVAGAVKCNSYSDRHPRIDAHMWTVAHWGPTCRRSGGPRRGRRAGPGEGKGGGSEGRPRTLASLAFFVRARVP